MNRILLTLILLLILSLTNEMIFAQRVKSSSNNIETAKTLVQYASIKSFSDGRGAWLEWKTESETGNLGFYVYRLTDNQTQLVSESMIAGAYLQARENKITAGTYSFFDAQGNPNSIYQIESFHLNNQRNRSDLIFTQAVKDLTKIAGVSSEQFLTQTENANRLFTRSETALPKDLSSESENYRQSPDPIKQRWVASQEGVKIGVKNEGIYRVLRADLEANGFDVNQPAVLWQLYVNGIEQAINVGENGEYIEFYGQGIDTPNADTQTYFLVVGAENGKRVGSVLRNRIGGSVISENYAQSFYRRERSLYVSGVLNGDEENFFGSVVNASSAPINFNLSGVDFTSANSSIDVTILGITLINHQTKVLLNNSEIGFINGFDYNSMSGTFTFPTSVLREGTNSLQLLTLNGIPGVANDVSLFDRMTISFARKYVADQNRLSFYVPNYKLSYAKNFTSPNIRVFDTTNADAPVLIKNLKIEEDGDTYRVVLPSNRSRILYAVEDSAILQPFSIAPNSTSTLSTAAHNADLIIITHKNWMPQAMDWADYRRVQNLSVEVVDVEDIFDEFNFGVLNPDAIRDFLQYARNNWQTAPSYALFLGDATYDPKNYLGVGNNNFVPTRLVDTVYSETGSDETLADFNDDGLAELAVGRIPARDAATVTLALNKVISFEQNVGQGLERGAIFASDLPNGYDFEGLSNRLCDQLPGTVNCVKINRGQPGANAALVSQMNTGRFLVNYSGHGSTGAWATTGFFSTSQAGQLNNANNFSIFTMLTCLNGYFIQPTDSLSEVLLKNPNGGAAATWASSGLTTPDVQEVMATKFYSQIGAGNLTRLGDLIKDAKTTINFGRDVRLSWVLLGDPTMKVK